MDNLANKKIVIVGLGREGISTYNFLRKKYQTQVVGLADKLPQEQLPAEAAAIIKNDKNITSHFGEDYLSEIKQYEVVIKSAGIPLKTVASYLGNATLSSATELFFNHCPAKIIGITGTKGKSTTTSVIYEVLKSGGKKAILCGNIGIPALDQLEKITNDSIIVMELSSHQLQTLTKSPYIAVLQNVVPEHLDYYESFEKYVAAKENITKFQTKEDFLLYNAGYPIPYEIAQRSRAKHIPFNVALGGTCCFVQGDTIVYRENNIDEAVMLTESLPIPGKFNIQNFLPAIIIGKLFSIGTKEIINGIKNFTGLEDRLEFVGTVAQVDYYNDSLSTVPESAIAALDAFEGKVETLLAGGFDRGLDFTDFGKHIVHSNIKNLILFPTTGEKIWQAVENEPRSMSRKPQIQHYFVNSMEEAVKIAKEHTSPGKVCLLSPASPSFGIFKDYHDRGLQFKNEVLRT